MRHASHDGFIVHAKLDCRRSETDSGLAKPWRSDEKTVAAFSAGADADNEIDGPRPPPSRSCSIVAAIAMAVALALVRSRLRALESAFVGVRLDLAAREEALRAADRSRRQMLADVSHELKTPLTALRGYLETLHMTDLELDPR